jgi:hypothetical protein
MPPASDHEPKATVTKRQRAWRLISAGASRVRRQLCWRNAVVIAVLGLGALGWGVYDFFAHPIMGAHVFTGFDDVATQPIERTTPNGTAYKLHPGRAIIGCDVRPDDAHSQRVFPSHGAAMQYAREHGLPTVPSVSAVLAACRVADARLQIALEHDLERHADGRAALLAGWLAEVVRRRTLATAAQRPIHDRAIGLIAQAIRTGGGSPILPDGFVLTTTTTPPRPGETPIGPWAADAGMAAIWHRDRFLANALCVTDDETAAVAAVLARSLVADAQQAAGWQRQSRAAAALVGKPSGPTLETLADALTTVADAELTSAQTCARVRALCKAAVAPAYAAWASSPEEAPLIAAGMSAWDDPFTTLIDAIRSGAITLTPNADSGFYRRWWYALESLAAPDRAPERGKLQLTPSYTTRWQRAFAAGFTDGRSGIVKRMPVLTLGMEGVGPVTAEVAPAFSCEPAPAVYLRLARAYRMLAHDLTLALGDERWRTLTDAQGRSLATAVEERSARLFGIATQSYREIGYPLPLADDERDIDQQGAASAGMVWCAASAVDADVAADARHLVTLAKDDAGQYRCPAIAGVRLEPVRFSWVEKPSVSGDIDPVFVPADYWLTAPCVLATTVERVPTPEEFRRECDRHDTVEKMYAAFRDTPMRSTAPSAISSRTWLIALSVLMLSGCALGTWSVIRLTKQRRWGLAVMVLLAPIVPLAWACWAPPYWLVRLVAVHGLTAHENIALVWQRPFTLWAAPHLDALFYDLLDEPDPQLRYWAVWLHTPNKSAGVPTHDQIAILDRSLDDGVDEVGWGAWFTLCRSRLPSEDLLGMLAKHPEFALRKYTLPLLIRERSNHPAVIAHVITQAASERLVPRTRAYAAISTWNSPLAEIITITRTGITDADPTIRQHALTSLGIYGNTSDLPAILVLLADPEPAVRIAAFRKIYHITDTPPKSASPKPRLSVPIGDPLIQRALIGYIHHPDTSFAERMSASRWLSDTDLLRQACHELMAEVDTLPSLRDSEQYVHRQDGYVKKWSREQATIHLVIRYLFADSMPTEERQSYDDTSKVENHPRLLAQLVEAVRKKARLADLVALVGDALRQPDDAVVAIMLIGRLGDRAASLAHRLADLHDHTTDPDVRWWSAYTLSEIGPEAVPLAIPRLQAYVTHPERGWLAERQLKLLQPGTTPPATDSSR